MNIAMGQNRNSIHSRVGDFDPAGICRDVNPISLSNTSVKAIPQRTDPILNEGFPMWSSISGVQNFW